MPKSKRSKVVHTSQVQKKPAKEINAALFELVQEAVDAYQHVFVFSVDNMRNTYLKEVRQHFSDSRMFFGKTKVMAKALGLTDAEEHAPGLHKLSKYLQGSVGLLCSNREPKEVLEYFEGFVEVDFARAGMDATRTFTVPAGVVYSTGGEQPAEQDLPMPHSLEATVRKWGMPTKLDKGKVICLEDYTVCKEGKPMNSDQTALLKLFGIATAEFKVQVLAYWSAASGEVEEIEGADAVMSN